MRWKARWCWTWSLSNARHKINDYLEKSPGAVGDSYTEPRFWQESSQLGPHTLPPETECGPRGDFELVGNLLYPDEGLDYTMPFLVYCLSTIEHLTLSCRRLLNVPVRQRLVFSAHFVAAERGLSVYNKIRQLIAYVIGQARDWPCSYCAAGNGVLRKCVTVDGEFGGACVNCSIDSQTVKCEWHPRLRPWERGRGPVVIEPNGNGDDGGNDDRVSDSDPLSEDDSDRAIGHIDHDQPWQSDHPSNKSRRNGPGRGRDASTPRPANKTQPYREQSQADEDDERSQTTVLRSIEPVTTEDTSLRLPHRPRPRPMNDPTLLSKRSRKRNLTPSRHDMQDEEDHTEKTQTASGTIVSPPPPSAPIPQRERRHKRGRLELVMSRFAQPDRHDSCEKHPHRACRDPHIGYLHLRPKNEVVYCDQKSQPRQARRRQVLYILSHCPCHVIDDYEGFWQASLRIRHDKGLAPYDGKEAYLSRSYSADLTASCSMYCPARPGRRFARNEVVVLED